MQCLTYQAGQLVSVVSVISAADCGSGQGACAGGGCSVSQLVLEPADVPANPFALSLEDGAAVGAAVLSVWLAAWAIRSVRLALND